MSIKSTVKASASTAQSGGLKRVVRRRYRRARRVIKRSVLKPFRLATGPIRVLPDFIIIGAQKGGTTSLFDYLAQHPQVRCSFEKEIGFFDLYFDNGLNWYRSHFPTSPQAHFFEDILNKSIASGEATPNYLWDPRVPRRVHETVPDVKLIVLLRNPVDRAYSHYHHVLRLGRENLSFEKAVDRELHRLIPNRHALLQDEGYLNTEYRWHWYLSRGIYVDQLQEWLSLFPRESMHVEKAEEFFTDTMGALDRIFQFLGLLPCRKISFEKKRNTGTYEKMDTSLRAELVQFFKPYNTRLYDLLGRNFEWDR